MSIENDELDPSVLEALALGLPSTGAPSDALRNRLFGLVGGRDRYLPFLDRMMHIFDLPEGEANEHLHSIDDPDAWEELVPGVLFRDFEAGPAAGEAHGGLVRVQAGESFPHHRHVGEERVLILQGRVRDEQGNEYRAGDIVVSAEGTAHELHNIGDGEVIYAALVIAIEFTGGDDDDDDDD